jgi:hypothetical protein
MSGSLLGASVGPAVLYDSCCAVDRGEGHMGHCTAAGFERIALLLQGGGR